MKKMVFVVSLLMFSFAAKAETLKGGYWACVSEDFFDQVTMAEIDGDKAALNYLSQNGCVITKSGIQITVLDRSWGTAKVRAYVGDTAVVLWTNTENIQR